MGENLEGVGRQKLIVPAVPPRTVGLDPAQPLQVEQVAGSVDDIEARSPTPIGALRPLILVAPSFDASMSWKWRKRGAPARVGAAFIRVHPRRSTPPETGRTRRARTASACAGRSSQTASAVSGPVIDSRAAAVYSMSWTGLR